MRNQTSGGTGTGKSKLAPLMDSRKPCYGKRKLGPLHEYGRKELGKIQNTAIARGKLTRKNELLKSHPNYSQPCDATKTKTRAAAGFLERQNQMFLKFQDRRHKFSSLLNVNFFNRYYDVHNIIILLLLLLLLFKICN